MELAWRTSLSIEQEEHLLKELSENTQEKLAFCGFSPSKLTCIVKHNPKVATQILLELKNTQEIVEYYKVLVNMDLSVHQLGLHSMEVVNHLTLESRVPPEFVHLYISNCIKSCETVTDPLFQTRLVRLVCVFLQSLIRSKVINLKELYVEIQTFCILFSRCKEVAALFRLVKKEENG